MVVICSYCQISGFSAQVFSRRTLFEARSSTSVLKRTYHELQRTSTCHVPYHSLVKDPIYMKMGALARLELGQICHHCFIVPRRLPIGRSKPPSINTRNIKYQVHRNDTRFCDRASGLLVPVSRPGGVVLVLSEPELSIQHGCPAHRCPPTG